MAKRTEKKVDPYTIHLKKRLKEAYYKGFREAENIYTKVSWSAVAFTVVMFLSAFIAGYIWGLNQ